MGVDLCCSVAVVEVEAVVDGGLQAAVAERELYRRLPKAASSAGR